MLVELAQERDEDIPALVYEARSTRQPRRLPHTRQQPQPRQHASSNSLNAQRHDDPSEALQEVTVTQAGSTNAGDRMQACCKLALCRLGPAVLRQVWCMPALQHAAADSANTSTDQLGAQQYMLPTGSMAPGYIVPCKTSECAQHNVLYATWRHQMGRSNSYSCRGD